MDNSSSPCQTPGLCKGLDVSGYLNVFDAVLLSQDSLSNMQFFWIWKSTSDSTSDSILSRSFGSKSTWLQEPQWESSLAHCLDIFFASLCWYDSSFSSSSIRAQRSLWNNGVTLSFLPPTASDLGSSKWFLLLPCEPWVVLLFITTPWGNKNLLVT